MLVALVLESLVVFAAGNHESWLGHKAGGADESNFIEAQVFIPEDTHLVEAAKPLAQPKAAEPVLSKVPNKGQTAKPAPVAEENQTDSGPALSPTHGPVAIYSVAPKIPPFLQENDLNASVVIDFYVSAAGESNPRLVGSSGNEELDAIAIKAARLWRFHPAEQDHHALDSKVRLRIVFEVK
ncbi:MAG: energy transducer TonB [Bdellovibrionota bacterium]